MNNSKILSNVPAVWYGNPSAVCYIGSVMRLMEYIDDPVEQDELFALSGVGLCFPWQFASSCDEVSIIPEIPVRTFEAFGYESEHLTGEVVSNKSACFDKIKQSIDCGYPVIGFGITTEMPMSCLIVGYDDNGLYTRSFYPPNSEKHDCEEYFYSSDWHEKCSGLLIIGKKSGERLTGAAAYARIVEWARNFRWERVSRGYSETVIVQGREIFINQHAFNAMIKWLLDDEQWQNPNESSKEQYLKQCGLLLFGHYRWQLFEYLKKLENQYPGTVNKPVLTALESIGEKIPGAHISDLWLHEVVDPALKDFSVMSERSIRQKVADYVGFLQGCDNIVQWTLFMPDFVKNQTQGFKVENFEYRKFPAMRFIGAEGHTVGEDDIITRTNVKRVLDGMDEYKSGFDYDVYFGHHHGKDAGDKWHGVWGRFMKADAPVPDGFISIDFVPHDVPVPGPPYYSCFAFAKFSGDMKLMHSNEGFDVDAMYDVTRNIILGDGVNIPYPEKYWTAEVFFNSFDEWSTGYLFSIGGEFPGK